MRCTVTGAKGRSVAGAEEGEASPMWRNRSVASVKEGEALPMRRNWSVADSEKSKRRRCSDRCESFVLAMVQVLSATSPIWRNRRVVDAQIVANHSYWWRFRFCWWRLLATSPIWRNRSVVDAQIVVNRLYQRQFKWLLATVVGYRRRFKWVIDDGTGFIGDGYQRWIGFLRTVTWFLLGLGWVWFFWERRTEGLWENRK